MNDHIISAGNGPLLVCLHGIGGSVESFRGQLDGLGDEFRVIARDAPGYANAQDPPSYPGVSGYVDEVVRLIEGEGAGSAALLGMSWGGVIATEVALARPDLLSALILGDSTRGSGQTPEQAAAMLSRVEELRSVGSEAYAAQRTRRLLAPNASADLLARAVESSTRSLRPEGFSHAARFMAETDLGSRLREVRVPTLVIYGEEDRVTGEPEARALAEGIPGARLVSIPDAGHLANQEQAERFNAAVRLYLREVAEEISASA